jgi:hypothetical protein
MPVDVRLDAVPKAGVGPVGERSARRGRLLKRHDRERRGMVWVA